MESVCALTEFSQCVSRNSLFVSFVIRFLFSNMRAQMIPRHLLSDQFGGLEGTDSKEKGEKEKRRIGG